MKKKKNNLKNFERLYEKYKVNNYLIVVNNTKKIKYGNQNT